MGYIKPLRRPPKNPSSGKKKKTLLGLRREALLNEWTAHAMDEHQWGERPSTDATALLDCADCARHVTQLKESEEWH